MKGAIPHLNCVNVDDGEECSTSHDNSISKYLDVQQNISVDVHINEKSNKLHSSSVVFSDQFLEPKRRKVIKYNKLMYYLSITIIF